MTLKVEIGSKVSVMHDKDTFDIGVVTRIDGAHVFVDFADWIQQWKVDDLTEVFIGYNTIIVASSTGVRITDFGHT